MLTKIEFKNFMSLKQATIKLLPLTVFIGANSSGKSAIFKGLITLSRLLRGTALRDQRGEFELEGGVPLDDIVWKGDTGLPIIFRAWFDDNDDDSNPDYMLELRRRAEGWGVTEERIRAGNGGEILVDEFHDFIHPTESRRDERHRTPLRGTLRNAVRPFVRDSAARPAIEPILGLSDRFGETRRYRPSANDIAATVRPPQLGGWTGVSDNGRGLALAIRDIKSSNPTVGTAIEDGVHSIFPHIERIHVKSGYRGLRLDFETNRSQSRVAASQESDGALLATFLLWRLHTAYPSVRVCLEEPENGLHPELTRGRYDLLKSFAYDSERPVQILVSTHSPELLRVMHSHHSTLLSEARLVKFEPRSGTQVRELTDYREAGQLIERYLAGNL